MNKILENLENLINGDILEKLENMKNGKVDIAIWHLNGKHTLPESPLWANVIKLNCSGCGLTELPELPNVKKLYCNHNNLTKLPKLPKVELLWCFTNRLTELPELPNVKVLNCYNNKLTYLPELPNVEKIICGTNQLTEMPEMPKIIEVSNLNCGSGNLMLFKPKHYKYVHQIRKIAIALSVIKQWRKFNQKSIKNKKQSLHNELLYSPDLPFYIEHLKAQHLFKQSE
ncbi:E3 ubiquitin-protein ligase [Pacmanvirus S19]|nr:E3 ubiquitin-protein ligase [Pacmanvirus S19]